MHFQLPVFFFLFLSRGWLKSRKCKLVVNFTKHAYISRLRRQITSKQTLPRAMRTTIKYIFETTLWEVRRATSHISRHIETVVGNAGSLDVTIYPGYPRSTGGRISSQLIMRFRFQNTNMSASCLALWVLKFGRRICESFLIFARIWVQVFLRSSQCGYTRQWIV